MNNKHSIKIEIPASHALIHKYIEYYALHGFEQINSKDESISLIWIGNNEQEFQDKLVSISGGKK